MVDRRDFLHKAFQGIKPIHLSGLDKLYIFIYFVIYVKVASTRSKTTTIFENLIEPLAKSAEINRLIQRLDGQEKILLNCIRIMKEKMNEFWSWKVL